MRGGVQGPMFASPDRPGEVRHYRRDGIVETLRYADAIAKMRFSDAEQAKSTGGMVALYPRTDYAQQLAIPGGEPPQDMHVTLAYLGEDVSDQDPGGISQGLSQIADSFTVIDARVMGHATFNGDGGPDGDMDPCAVYLISDAEQLSDLHKDVLDLCTQQFNLPQQHLPWIPHLTAGYGIDQDRLDFHGLVLFDRVGFKFAGRSHVFPLLGSTSSESID